MDLSLQDIAIRAFFRLAAVYYGNPPDSVAIAPPLGSLQDAIDIFAGKMGKASPYLRGGHEAVTALEEAYMEHEQRAVDAVAVASGQAANALVFDTLMQGGGRIVVSKLVFGGTLPMIELKAKAYGAEIIYVDPADVQSIADAVTPETKAVFVESISNPGNIVAPLIAIAQIAFRNNAAFVVDNTLGLTLCDPFSGGANIVTCSLTKYANGDNRDVGGIIAVGDDHQWLVRNKVASPKFPFFTALLPRNEKSLVAAFDELPEAITKGYRKLAVLNGPTLSIASANHMTRNLRRLRHRMEKHQGNTKILNDFLLGSDEVANVRLPGNGPDHANNARAKEYFHGNTGSIITFDLRGGKAAAARFIDQINRDGLIGHRANLGQEQSIVTWPWGTTHVQLTPEQKAEAGITEGTIRFSVGVENPQLIRAALGRALKATHG